MIVEVTQEDIDNGSPANAGHCPIALAVKRATGARDVVVSVERSGEIYVHNDKTTVYRHTKASGKFVTKFDEDKPVKPFKFRLIKKENKNEETNN